MSERSIGDAVVFKIGLEAWGHTLEASARVPTGRLRVTDLLPILDSFDDALIAIAASAVERQGDRVSCREGCASCCRQLIPISEPEARYLAELVETMPASRQAVIRARFRENLEALERHGLLARMRKPSDPAAPEERTKTGEEYFGLWLPCPFLEGEACSIYLRRPMSCREFLVASPPENCRNPTPESVLRVPLPARLSEILYTFGQETACWLPLVLALEWIAERGQERQPTHPGPELFRSFLSCLG